MFFGEPHQGIRGKCSLCRQPAPAYDRLPKRSWLFIPLREKLRGVMGAFPYLRGVVTLKAPYCSIRIQKKRKA
jgi:hypothetical protein